MVIIIIIINSQELRELESKLRAGYMNKERAAQLQEKIEIKEKEKVNTYTVHIHVHVLYCILYVHYCILYVHVHV